MITLRDSDVDRFWTYVNKSKTCWLWTGGKSSRGYGFFWLKTKSTSAHRVSFFLAHGTLPASLDVLHRCDVPLCVNPAHLFLGTQRDNGRDMAEKGRSLFGEKHNQAKLTELEVVEIRRKRANGFALKELADEFCVTGTLISYICNRKIWRHI